MKHSLLLAAFACSISSLAVTAESIPQGALPTWVPQVAPHLSNRPDDASQHVRYELVENHHRAFGTHAETYARMRVRVLSPLGLQAASQLGIVWNPALQTPTLHQVRVIRAGESLDVLAQKEFTVLRREAALEQSLQINGVLTGVLVVPDLRVGDVVDFAYSMRSQFDLFDNPVEAQVTTLSPLPIDQVVTSYSWPVTMRVQTRAGRHSVLPPIERQGDFQVLVHRALDLEAQDIPQGLASSTLPDYGWQISSSPRWGVIADHIRPAYEAASHLPDAPDLAQHIARIRSEHATPKARAEAALRLVQDEVRYMAITLGEGGWVPATAAEVWASRQGDCKGKTVLLVALLRALGIEAVPVLVSSENLALNKYLPMVSAFDHVIVRTRIGDETYLLDGARLGDRSLTPDVPLVHEYGLPIIESADLEPLPLRLPSRPIRELHVEIDFSEGVYSPARVTVTDFSRGGEATEMQAGISQIPAAQLARMYDEKWSTFLKDFGAVSDLKSEWEYREASHEFVAKGTGLVSFDWSDGRADIPLAHVTWRGREPHPGELFRDADHGLSFPRSSSFKTTIILPEGETPLDVAVEPYEVEAGATRYFRTVRRLGNRLETDRGSVTLRPFATAAETGNEQAQMDRFKDLTATMSIRRDYALTPKDRVSLTSTQGLPEEALRRGYALFDQQDLLGALAQFNAAIEGFSSPNANAYANRALVHLALDDLAKARADIAASEAADPQETVLYHAKGQLAEIEDDNLGAVLAFSEAIRLWPENIHALHRRARAYEEMGQSTRALADLERIQGLRPQDLETISALATQLMRMGRTEAAYEQTGKLAEVLGAPQAKVQLFISLAQMLAGTIGKTDPAKAEKILTETLAIEDDFPALLIDRARLREVQGKSAEAVRDLARFKELTRIDLEDHEAACQMPSLYRHSLNEALAQCDKAIGLKPELAELHIRRGYILYSLSRNEAAIAAYQMATRLAPHNQMGRFGLGFILKDEGNHAEGEAMMAAALEADPRANLGFEQFRFKVVFGD